MSFQRDGTFTTGNIQLRGTRYDIKFIDTALTSTESLVAQSLSRVQLFATPWTAARQASLSFTISWVCSNDVHRIGDAIQPSHLLSSPSPPALRSFPASGSFLMSQLLASNDQSIGASASVPVLPMNIQGWFRLGLTGLIFCCPRNSQESSPTL